MLSPAQQIKEVGRRLATYRLIRRRLLKHTKPDDAGIIALDRCIKIATNELAYWKAKNGHKEGPA